jgi:hypothetical protein
MTETITTEQAEKINNQLERTSQLITKLESQRYLQIIDRPFKFLFMAFLQGVFVALGSTVGLALVVGGVLYILNKLQVFAPLQDNIKDVQNALQNIKN